MALASTRKRTSPRLALLLISSVCLRGQTTLLPVDRGAAGLWNALQRLHTRASLMMITAHPDDEDGGMLTWESRGQGARTILLSLTRGESGANVMSPDFFDALGLVRTEELLAAGRYYGVEQYFASVVNNGFSKTKEETLHSWGRDRVLADAVRIVRMTRPLVVTSVFIGGPSDGHGNHQVAGGTAQEVFKAAGDPAIFPEQIKAGLRPWKPLKMYARIPMARVTEKGVYDYATHHWVPARIYDYIHGEWLPWNISADVQVPEGDPDPLAGLSYVQIAREGLGFQKSQNGGTGVPPAGGMAVTYHRFGSVVPVSTGKESSFFDGIDISLTGIVDLAGANPPPFLRESLDRINRFVEDAIADFRANEPARLAPALASGMKQTIALIEQVASSGIENAARNNVLHELNIKKAQFNAALVLALGLTIEANVATGQPADPALAMYLGTPDTFRIAIPGQQFRVEVRVNKGSTAQVELKAIRLQTPQHERWTVAAEGNTSGLLGNNQPKRADFRVTVDRNAKPTRPYFARPDVERGWYDLQDKELLGRPFAPYPLIAHATIQFDGAPLELVQTVQTVRHVNRLGSVPEPLLVGPAISISVSPTAGIIAIGAKSLSVSVKVQSFVKGPSSGRVKLQLPDGWRSEPAAADFNTARDGDEQHIDFRVLPSEVAEKPYIVAALAEFEGQEYREGFHLTGYQGLRPYPLYKAAAYKASGVDVKVAPGLNVGYVMGSGDDVPLALENLGVRPKLLTAVDLDSGDLSRFDAIVLGIRAYAVREDLKASNTRLLDYVKNGGVLIVQYNTPEFDHNYGPYPYVMTNDPEEVTDEESRIDFLSPKNPVFNWPNRIGAKDFEGWVSERGSKFIHSWDSRYEVLLETHDPDQDPQKGGLLYARYGKGIYIYNAYALYRQLPEGVPGAYRFMANLVSLAKNPDR